ncbi:MAG: hypothetical protein J2P57_13425, partial [Acidimicrobiaceae bacterium]|nr:hypothetical protein [Acidimicrobiaceae bacterium]
VLAYDADAAGQAAADRFYAWERRFEVDICVADLPAGADPADLAARDPDRLRDAIAGARPYLAFRLARLLGRADLSGPEGRVRAATEAMQLIAAHPNELVRDQYLMQVADRCQVEPARLRAMLGRGPRRGAPVPAGPPPAPVPDPIALPKPELEVLRVAVHRPEDVAHRLDRALFAHPLAVRAFDVLAGASTFAEAVESADPQIADLLQRLAVEPPEHDTDSLMARLVDRAGTRALRELRTSATYEPVHAWLPLTLEALRSDDPAARVDAEQRLVDWLVARSRHGDVANGDVASTVTPHE